MLKKNHNLNNDSSTLYKLMQRYLNAYKKLKFHYNLFILMCIIYFKKDFIVKYFYD